MKYTSDPTTACILSMQLYRDHNQTTQKQTVNIYIYIYIYIYSVLCVCHCRWILKLYLYLWHCLRDITLLLMALYIHDSDWSWCIIGWLNLCLFVNLNIRTQSGYHHGFQEGVPESQGTLSFRINWWKTKVMEKYRNIITQGSRIKLVALVLQDVLRPLAVITKSMTFGVQHVSELLGLRFDCLSVAYYWRYLVQNYRSSPHRGAALSTAPTTIWVAGCSNVHALCRRVNVRRTMRQCDSDSFKGVFNVSPHTHWRLRWRPRLAQWLVHWS